MKKNLKFFKNYIPYNYFIVLFYQKKKKKENLFKFH